MVFHTAEARQCVVGSLHDGSERTGWAEPSKPLYRDMELHDLEFPMFGFGLALV